MNFVGNQIIYSGISYHWVTSMIFV